MKQEIKYNGMVLVIIVQTLIIFALTCYLIEVLKAGQVLTFHQFMILE